MKKALKIVGILVAAFILIQLVPYGRNHTNPAVVAEPAWDSPQTRALAQRACFDCHSNETVWPWYSNVAPFSWLIQHDVDEARETINFSNWKTGQNTRRANEAAAEVQRGSMPPVQYWPMHPNAILSEAEKTALANGLKASLK